MRSQKIEKRRSCSAPLFPFTEVGAAALKIVLIQAFFPKKARSLIMEEFCRSVASWEPNLVSPQGVFFVLSALCALVVGLTTTAHASLDIPKKYALGDAEQFWVWKMD